jgi:hypothetical protein
MTVPVPETVYDSVVYQYGYGTLKLNEEQLSFHTDEKVSVLPWKKVVRRQVTASASNVAKPMFKLILKSGNEAVFQMEDRISLEVLRDDLGERLKTWRKLHPELSTEQDKEESVAVNKTRNSLSSLRQSTPYRMVSQNVLQEIQEPTIGPPRSHSFSNMPQADNKPKQRRASTHMDQSICSEPFITMGSSSKGAMNARRRASAHVDQSTRSAPDPTFIAATTTTKTSGRYSHAKSSPTSSTITKKPTPAPASVSSSKGPRRATLSPVRRTNSGDLTAKQSNRRSMR